MAKQQPESCQNQVTTQSGRTPVPLQWKTDHTSSLTAATGPRHWTLTLLSQSAQKLDALAAAATTITSSRAKTP